MEAFKSLPRFQLFSSNLIVIALMICLFTTGIKCQHPDYKDFKTKEDYHEPKEESMLNTLVEHNHEEEDFNLLYAQVFLLVGFAVILILVGILLFCTYVLCCHNQTKRSCIKNPYSSFDDNEIVQSNSLRESEKKLQKIFEEQDNVFNTPKRNSRTSQELRGSVCNSEARFIPVSI